MADNYRIGQVLYVIPMNTANLIPIQVTEKRISETVEGTKIMHLARVPKPKAKPVILETVKGRIFADLRSAREFMVRNATAAIDAMIKQADGHARQAFAPPEPQHQLQADDPFDIPGNLIDVDADDIPIHDAGLPELPATIQQQPMQVPQRQSMPAPSDLHDVDESGLIEIMLPNGEKRKVRPKS